MRVMTRGKDKFLALKTMALCGVVAAVLSFAVRADVTTNIWQGADGAAWGTPASRSFRTPIGSHASLR